MFGILCLFCLCVVVMSQECTHRDNGQKGRCVYMGDCPTAQRDLKYKIYPQICSFNGTSKIPNICCLEEAQNITAILRPELTKRRSEEDGECFLYDRLVENTTRPLGVPADSKAWKKCRDIESKIKLPCKDGKIFVAPYCGRETVFAGPGGIDAVENEFPHMALLTYGKVFNESEFGCGGSLISEKFVLTAGHCAATSASVPVSFAVFGLLDRKKMYNAPEKNIRAIQRIIRHPDYKPPAIYHDIALLELEKEIVISVSIRPACLQVSDELGSRAYAAGWGAVGHRKMNADILQNIPLWKVEDEDCKAKYAPHRKFINGLDNTTQVCYGDDGIVRDTCSGDSGGPLHIRNRYIFCTHLILGVTSFGKYRCGEIGTPGVYTKVLHYVPWIESVVWP